MGEPLLDQGGPCPLIFWKFGKINYQRDKKKKEKKKEITN
jgi:hypothetical protein